MRPIIKVGMSFCMMALLCFMLALATLGIIPEATPYFAFGGIGFVFGAAILAIATIWID